jgi:hypothetical protein
VPPYWAIGTTYDRLVLERPHPRAAAQRHPTDCRGECDQAQQNLAHPRCYQDLMTRFGSIVPTPLRSCDQCPVRQCRSTTYSGCLRRR